MKTKKVVLLQPVNIKLSDQVFAVVNCMGQAELNFLCALFTDKTMFDFARTSILKNGQKVERNKLKKGKLHLFVTRIYSSFVVPSSGSKISLKT